MLETIIPMLLKAMGYEKAQFDTGIAKAESFAEELKTRLLNTEKNIADLNAKIDLLISQKQGE